MILIRTFSTAWPLILAAMIAHPAALRAQTSPPPLAPRSSAPAQPAPARPAASAPSQAKPATQAPAAKPAAPAAAAKPAAGSDQPKLLGQYDEWGAYTASPDGKKICFVLAKPGSSKTDPPNRPRDPAYFFISTRPAEKVKEEVSVIIGYSFKPKSEAKAEIGSASFAMYTQDDGAWVKNAADETKLVETLRKGADLVIKGTSSRGTLTTDTYSLKGASQALERIDKECK